MTLRHWYAVQLTVDGQDIVQRVDIDALDEDNFLAKLERYLGILGPERFGWSLVGSYLEFKKEELN